MLKHTRGIPGAAPGVEHDEIRSLPSKTGEDIITCIDYCPNEYVIKQVEDIEAFLAQHRPEWAHVRWIDVTGLADMQVIHLLATKYNLHPLAVEDLLHISQRPKVETYGGEDSELQARLFIVTHALTVENGELKSEQVSVFLGHNTVLTFQAAPVSAWEPIIQRIKKKDSRLRNGDASFLMYSLLDANIDCCFPILENYGDQVEELEDGILETKGNNSISEIHQLKRDLLLIRRVIWPMREVVSNLQREPHECVSEMTRVYMRDLYDHVIQLIDIIEIYREMISDLTETYVSSVSNRMNEIMKVLTIIGTIFIPLTFLSGVYGMNFEYIPELSMPYAYPVFWAACILIVSGLILFFRRHKWM